MATVISTVALKWIDGTFMLGVDSRGQAITIGRKKDDKGEWFGVKASDLLLLAAASCSTYDVITILSKQREPYSSIDVECHGEQETEPPYAFISIHLHYKIKGRVNPEKVDKAIKLSEEKYCSVLATLRSGVKISSDFEIIED